MSSGGRREFIAKCGAGLAGIITAQQAPAVIVRSLVAANGIGFAGDASGWKNPYVTKGLIAMWDGEWNDIDNEGVFKHNSSTDTWLDISGHGNDVSLSQWANWSDNALVCDGTHYMGYVEPSGISSLWHCEIAYNRTYTSYGYLCYLANKNINSENNADLTLAFKGNDFLIGTGHIPIDYVFKNTSWKNVPLATTMSINFREGRFFINGDTEMAATYVKEEWSQKQVGEIGGRMARTGNVYKGSIYCMRIYNRVLTDKEMAINNEVDKKRFGL